MLKEEFIAKFTEIVSTIENTNYGSIIAEFKLVILIQELVLTNSITIDEILNIFEIEINKDEGFEARNQALGEIYMNLKNAHKWISIFDDFGKDYTQRLFVTLNLYISNGGLFEECNS